MIIDGKIFFSMAEIAQKLDFRVKNKVIGRNEIFKILREKKILQEGNNLAFKKYIDIGYFKTLKIEISDKEKMYDKTTFKTLVSEKGFKFILEVLESHFKK